MADLKLGNTSNRGAYKSKSSSIYQGVSNVNRSKGITGKVLLIIFMVLFIVSFGRTLFHYSEPITTYTFLNILQNAPSITFRLPFSLTIDNQWVILDGLREFINIFGSILEVVCWIGNMLIQVLEYIVYLLVNLLGIRM